MSSGDFPVFFFDCNATCGLVDSRTALRRIVQDLLTSPTRFADRDAAIQYVLLAKIATSPRELPEDAKSRAIAVAFEQIGKRPSFGYRREHVHGTISLEDWLQASGIDASTLLDDETAQ